MKLPEQIQCVEREIDKRAQVYPRLVEAGKLSQDKANHELAGMRAVLATLRGLEQPSAAPPEQQAGKAKAEPLTGEERAYALERLERLVGEADLTKLNPWGRTFIEDLSEKWQKYGPERLILTEKQAQAIDREYRRVFKDQSESRYRGK